MRRLVPTVRAVIAPVIAVAALTAPCLSAPPAGAASAQGDHVAILFLPGPKSGNTGPSMHKRLAAREQLSLAFMGSTQGAYRPPQVMLDISAGSRVAFSLYDTELPHGVRLLVSGSQGLIARWPAILRRANTVPADVEPGLLASSLRAHGASIGYLGRSPRRRNVEAIVAAGRDGRVAPVEFVSSRQMTARALSLWRSRDVVICDLARGGHGYAVLDALLERRRPNDVLMVIQTPPRSPRRLLAMGAAGLGAGSALRSGSTRRAGLVTATDIAPTVLQRLGVSIPHEVQGQPIEATDNRSVDQISSLRGRLTQVGPRRWKVTLGGLGIAILIVLLAGVGRAGRVARAGRAGLLAAMWLPGVLLVTGALSTTRFEEALLVGVTCALLALLSERLVPWPRTPWLAAAGSVGAHLADLAFGSGLIVRSLLGPNPILGARYYGIGNELEISLAVIALVGIGAATATSKARVRVWTFVVAGGAVALLMSWGRMGADVGASLTLGVGVAVAAVASLEGTPLRRKLIIVLAAPAAAVALLAAVDLATGGDAHFTRSVLRAGGMRELGQVFQRKLESSYGSLSRGAIPGLALAAAAALIVGIWRRRSLLSPLKGFPGLSAGIYGALAAVVAGALTNDSGPVILLIGTVYLALTVGYVHSAQQGSQRPVEKDAADR